MLLFAVAAQAAPAIPYRTSTAVPAGSVASSLIVVGVVLLALIVAAVMARRKGWLARFGLGAKGSSEEVMQVTASCRLSVHATAHVLRYKGKEFLVLESSRGTSATIARMDGSALPEGAIK